MNLSKVVQDVQAQRTNTRKSDSASATDKVQAIFDSMNSEPSFELSFDERQFLLSFIGAVEKKLQPVSEGALPMELVAKFAEGYFSIKGSLKAKKRVSDKSLTWTSYHALKVWAEVKAIALQSAEEQALQGAIYDID